MNLPDLLKDLNTQVGAIAAIITAVGGLVTLAFRAKTYLTRSRLLKSDAFPLPEVPGEQAIFAPQLPELNTLLVGRDPAVTEVSAKVRASILTFVYGESGSGKSTFLKLGLCRDLVQRRWAPIYVDIWGTDWVSGPLKALANATDYAIRALKIGDEKRPPVTRDTVFEELRTMRAATGFSPILVFDQVDDYQNAHRARFRDSASQFFLKPDELCAANPFWKAVRDLLLHPTEPIHILLATREDAQDGLHCFAFAGPRVYRLPRLDPQDAAALIQRLSPEGVIKNPQNGFTELTQRIVSELGRDGQGAILPMQLRIALAGLGRLNGPLTPGRVEKLGGVSALGALYLDAVLRTSPDAWPILNAMAERTPTGKGKAVALPREQVLALIPGGVKQDELLQHLADTRILRRRLADSPEADSKEDEVWQLYHDYLADAIVALDRRKRKWRLLLSDAAERFRLSDGPTGKWASLLSPLLQLKLIWRRLKDRDFRYGEHAGFARLSLTRLLLNPWTLSLAIGLWAWTYWQDTRAAQQIVDAFQQGDGHETEEYDALWRLATSGSQRMAREVFGDFFSTEASADAFNKHSAAIVASAGLRPSRLDASMSLTESGPCEKLKEAYLTACSTIAELSGDQARLANRIADLLGKDTGYEEAVALGCVLEAIAPQLQDNQAERLVNRIVEQLGKANGLWSEGLSVALAALAPHLKGDQAERGANRIVELLGKATGSELGALGSALEALASHLNGDQAARVANRIVERLGKATEGEAAHLGRALAAIAPQLKGDQAERGANRIVGLLCKATGYWAADLGDALAAIAPQLKGDQAERGANRIVELLGKATGNEAEELGGALEAFAPQLKSDQAERVANSIVGLLCKATGYWAADLGDALAAFAPQLKGDQAERGANRIVELLSNASSYEAAHLGRALAAIAPQLKGDQAERGANRMVELLGKANGLWVEDLSGALAAFAPRLKGDQAERGANRMVELLGKATGDDAALLGRAVAGIAPQLLGNQAERGANRIVELLGKATGSEAEALASSLEAFAPQLKGDQAERIANSIADLLGKATAAAELGRTLAALVPQIKIEAEREALLAKFMEQRRAMPCDTATANTENVALLVDMLKWPVCTGRDGLMLRIAELQKAQPTEFGQFTKAEEEDRSTFHADLRRFIAWLKTQRDQNGHPFDVDGPPVWSPGHTKTKWLTSQQR